MQSAAGSLRGAGPSRPVKIDDATVIWGIGSDRLALSGNYRFRILKGALTICGITLSLPVYENGNEVGPSAWYSVCSPVAPFPIISPAHSHNQSSCQIPNELSSFATIIEVRESLTPLDVSKLAPPFKPLWHNLQRVENTNNGSIKIPASWREILSSRSGRGAEHHFLVLGPKNSGKSGLARYLCNSLLGTPNRQIYYLDLDPGQPEYTPPGYLTLHRISNYNFSPSHAHTNFEAAIKSHYLGYTSPMETPGRYLSMCHDLLDTFHRTASASDYLVVNTSGWTKGLGLDLNTEIARMFDSDKALPIHIGPSELEFEVEEVERIDNVSGNNNSTESMSTITSSGYSGAELRSLQITCYLHQHNFQHLTTWAPYDLGVGSEPGQIWGIAVMDSTGVDLEKDLAICIEGTVVSINLVKTPPTAAPGILPAHISDDIWQHGTCIGMGVVQSLAKDFRSLRLLTPLDPSAHDLSSHQIVIVRGRIQLPVWELHNRDFPTCPWVSSTRAVGTGATYTKFRRNIRRN